MATPSPQEAPKKEPKESHAVIRQLTPNVTIISLPFSAGIAEVGTRTTVLRLPTSGALLVYCPADLDDEVRAAIAAMGGPVKYLVCGNIGHHVFIHEWAAAFPDAQFIAPDALADKRQKQKLPEVAFQYRFTATNRTDNAFLPAELTADLEVEYLGGSIFGEIAIFHKADKVLLVCDLLWTFPSHEHYSKSPKRKPSGGLTSVLNRVGWDDQVHGRLQVFVRRVLSWYVLGSRDRKSFIQSIVHIHEDWEGEAKRIYACVFKWQLEAAKKQK
jgi:hypothetical protein